jgi:phenylacetate-CoA ligase
VIKLIQGRSNDFITLPSGKVISPLLLGVCLEKIEGIGQYKLVQESKDILNVQIVRGQNFNEATISEFEKALRKTLSNNVHININIVDEIPREKSGKIRPIVSKVSVSL